MGEPTKAELRLKIAYLQPLADDRTKWKKVCDQRELQMDKDRARIAALEAGARQLLKAAEVLTERHQDFSFQSEILKAKAALRSAKGAK